VQKVLLSFDGSVSAEKAAQVAARVARALGVPEGHVIALPSGVRATAVDVAPPPDRPRPAPKAPGDK
jgi:nucleotide-binding universal stress UspA family protein